MYLKCFTTPTELDNNRLADADMSLKTDGVIYLSSTF